MAYGFKEWAIVCQALQDGRQSIILRKGGIAEGRAGFRFEHEEFYLLPTFFHEQLARTRLPQTTTLPQAAPGEITINALCRVVIGGIIRDAAQLQQLERFHILASETVHERFAYGPEPALHVVLVRTYRLHPAWVLADDKRFAGCRSWVELPPPPACELTQVIDDCVINQTHSHLSEILA